MASARRAHDRPQVPRIHFLHRNGAFLSQEMPRALQVFIAAGHQVALAREQLGEQ